jgi:hypothetical protein
LAANPFTTGNDVVSNVLTSASGIPGATVCEIWNPVSGKFKLLTYNGNTGSWGAGGTNAIAPGTGFFLNNPNQAFTNTFVGTVVTPAGGSVTNNAGTGLQLLGSQTPYTDVVTNQSTINLGSPTLAGGSSLELWNSTTGKFILFTLQGNNWTRNPGSVVTNPPVAVGQGFFVNSGTPVSWVQTLP